MKQPHVIGLSSYGGGGKTTLTRYLAATLKATVLFWDDYDEAGLMIHPKDWRSWLTEGADNNAWKVPQLAKDLAQLKQGQSIVSPLHGSSIVPTNYIVFDAPLGYAQQETGKYIDTLVFIDTPLDVAMARRILRDYFSDAAVLEKRAANLKAEMESYLEFSRDAYLNMDKTIKPYADLILDGLLPVAVLAEKVIGHISSKL